MYAHAHIYTWELCIYDTLWVCVNTTLHVYINMYKYCVNVYAHTHIYMYAYMHTHVNMYAILNTMLQIPWAVRYISLLQHTATPFKVRCIALLQHAATRCNNVVDCVTGAKNDTAHTEILHTLAYAHWDREDAARRGAWQCIALLQHTATNCSTDLGSVNGMMYYTTHLETLHTYVLDIPGEKGRSETRSMAMHHTAATHCNTVLDSVNDIM